MNENLANEVRKTIESVKDLKTKVGGINNHLGILEGLVRSDYQKKVDEAYQRGYDKGYADKTNNDKVCKDLAKDIYQRGLNDAWEAARKIVLNPEDSGIILTDLFVMFGHRSIQSVFRNYSASEAIAKLKAYGEKQKAEDEIKVGDEVAFQHDDGRPDTVVVVTYIGQDGFIDGMDGRGTQYAHKNPTKWTKTGRHFDIASILEDMKNE